MGNNDRKMRVLPGRNGRGMNQTQVINPGLARDLTPKEEPKTPEQLVSEHPDPAMVAFGVCQQFSGMLARDEADTAVALAHMPADDAARPAIQAVQDRLKAERKRLMAISARAFAMSMERRGLGETNLSTAEATVALAETELKKRAAAKTPEAPKEPTP